jgi:hypothetical protein
VLYVHRISFFKGFSITMRACKNKIIKIFVGE